MIAFLFIAIAFVHCAIAASASATLELCLRPSASPCFALPSRMLVDVDTSDDDDVVTFFTLRQVQLDERDSNPLAVYARADANADAVVVVRARACFFFFAARQISLACHCQGACGTESVGDDKSSLQEYCVSISRAVQPLAFDLVSVGLLCMALAR